MRTNIAIFLALVLLVMTQAGCYARAGTDRSKHSSNRPVAAAVSADV